MAADLSLRVRLCNSDTAAAESALIGGRRLLLAAANGEVVGVTPSGWRVNKKGKLLGARTAARRSGGSFATASSQRQQLFKRGDSDRWRAERESWRRKTNREKEKQRANGDAPRIMTCLEKRNKTRTGCIDAGEVRIHTRNTPSSLKTLSPCTAGLAETRSARSAASHRQPT